MERQRVECVQGRFLDCLEREGENDDGNGSDSRLRNLDFFQ